ncbi:MAG: hypothetical protein Q8N99_00745 [Nanoarchaeota archaeon]|nr:hypothetical protein [Nanoarchaeota archaeon]
MNEQKTAERALEQGEGILRLKPNWVPRSFCIPGRRIKLHPDDYYALGCERGGIDERWFSSTIEADNGPLTAPNEGLSFVVFEHKGKVEEITLKDVVAELELNIVGERLWNQYHEWPMYSKFFDNQGPLPHHVHQRDVHVASLGKLGKPEAYYFPPQANNCNRGDFPFTFFGLNPGVTKDELRQCLENFTKGDNRITALSHAHQLVPGTGWDVPAGVLHAPGSFCTYEPQARSDVFAMYQSVIQDRQVVPNELLWKDTPDDKVGNIDWLIEVLDWELNVSPNFVKNRFMRPIPVLSREEMRAEDYIEKWICYKSPAFSAKELTILPGKTVTIRDNAAYGFIMMQGNGSIFSSSDNGLPIETPALIRYGQLTHDEYFVTEEAAKRGVTITNPSKTDPIVMLKHFGPKNPDLKTCACGLHP